MEGEFNTPGPQLFADFCESVLKEVGLPLQPVAAVVEQLEPTGRVVSATLSGGARMVARRAIVASNGAGPHWPVWARRARSEAPPERICHAEELRLDLSPTLRGARRATVTRSTAAVVERLRSSGALCLCQAGVERAEWRSGAWQVRTREGPTIQCDWIWLATGWTPSLADHTLLDPLQRRRPAAIVGGMPLLEDNLAWPGTPIHLTGSLAALRVGPVAPNLSGARIAAERIAGSLVPLHTRQYPT